MYAGWLQVCLKCGPSMGGVKCPCCRNDEHTFGTAACSAYLPCLPATEPDYPLHHARSVSCIDICFFADTDPKYSHFKRVWPQEHNCPTPPVSGQVNLSQLNTDSTHISKRYLANIAKNHFFVQYKKIMSFVMK